MLFLAASVTASFIPRDWLVQGVLGGLVMALGYLIGRAVMGLWWAMELPTLKGRAAVLFYVVIVVPVAVVLVFSLVYANDWQNDIRSRMGMALVENSHTTQMDLLAALVFGGLIRSAFNAVRRRLYRFMPVRTANITGLMLVGFVLLVVTRDGIT